MSTASLSTIAVGLASGPLLLDGGVEEVAEAGQGGAGFAAGLLVIAVALIVVPTVGLIVRSPGVADVARCSA